MVALPTVLPLDLHLDCGHNVTVDIPVVWGPARGTELALSFTLDKDAVRKQMDAHRAGCR